MSDIRTMNHVSRVDAAFMLELLRNIEVDMASSTALCVSCSAAHDRFSCHHKTY